MEKIKVALETYNLYLKGNYYLNKWTPHDAKNAILYFDQAIQDQPDFYEPYISNAKAHFFLRNFGYTNPTFAFEKIKEYTRKAIFLDGMQPDPYVLSALSHMYIDRNWEEAGKQFKVALKYGKQSPYFLENFAWYLCGMKMYDKAVHYMDKALQYDPLNLNLYESMGTINRYAGNYDTALHWYKQALALQSDYRSCIEKIGLCYLSRLEVDKAIVFLNKYKSLVQNPLGGCALLGFAYARRSDLEKAHNCLALIKERRKKEPNINVNIDFAILHLGLIEYDEALQYLEKNFELGLGTIFLLCDPLLHPLHTKKRYQRLVGQIHFGETFFTNIAPQVHIKTALKEELRIAASDLIYTQSEGNYSRIVYKHFGLVKEKLLRVSTKSLEEQLCNNDVVRCHKSFIVNLQQPFHLSGNIRNSTLICPVIDQPIPVSRALVTEIRVALKRLYSHT